MAKNHFSRSDAQKVHPAKRFGILTSRQHGLITIEVQINCCMKCRYNIHKEEAVAAHLFCNHTAWMYQVPEYGQKVT